MMGTLSILCILSVCYFHFVIKDEIVYTHFFYIPIVLACMWWGWKGMAVAAVLAASLVIIHIACGTEVPVAEELVQGTMFVVIGGIVAALVGRRKRLNEELRETRDYLENLLNYANAPIIVWGPEFKITRFNRAFERLTGRSADKVIGKRLEVLFPEDAREESMDHIRRTMKGERWEAVEIPILRADGTVRIALWNSANLYAADGKEVVATIAQGQDITERKQAEEELKRRVDELERFHGLVVCRELKMVELKERIRELEGGRKGARR